MTAGYLDHISILSFYSSISYLTIWLLDCQGNMSYDVSQGGNGLPCVTFDNLPPPLPVSGFESDSSGSMKEDIRNAATVLLQVCIYLILNGPIFDRFHSSLSNMWRTWFLYLRRSHHYKLAAMKSNTAALLPRMKSHSHPSNLRSPMLSRRTSPFIGLWGNVYRLSLLSVRLLLPCAMCSSACAGHPLSVVLFWILGSRE